MRVFTFLTIIGLLLLLTIGMILADARRSFAHDPVREEILALVRALQLTDLALWTEARYTRHPSQADSFTPFQSGPSALEHFPSGSWVPPPTRFQAVFPDSLIVQKEDGQP